MLIGIDASRAFVAERTGTENYSYQLITHMLRLIAAKKHTFVLFIRPNAKLPKELAGYSNVIVKKIKLPVLWTQVGLALATRVTKLDLLWIPAHTLPVFRPRALKTVVTIHGLEYKYLREYKNQLQRWYLPLSTYYAAVAADKLICVSQSTQRELVGETGVDIEKTIVIYEGVEDKSKITNNKSKTKLKTIITKTLEKYGIEEKKYILFVGTVQPRKNLMALISAFAEFRTQYPDYKLVIAGSVGWEAEAELRAPTRLRIPESVVFCGRVTPGVLQVLYQGAGVYVQPSWTEGFGLPVLEAMAQGVSVIVSDGGALPEVVGEAGIVVPLGIDSATFVTKLGKAIAAVVGDQQRQKQLRAAGRKRVGQFGWERAAKETLAYLTTG